MILLPVVLRHRLTSVIISTIDILDLELGASA
jgi:hypothetical protein